MDTTRAALESLGLPSGDLRDLPDSPARFPDGASFRIEIPSTEGPRGARGRARGGGRRARSRSIASSQGSGGFLLTDDELDEMVRLAADARVEVSLFAQPTAAWGPVGARALGQGARPSAAASPRAGRPRARARGHPTLGRPRDPERADHRRRAAARVPGDARAGVLPPDMQAKMSVLLPIANPSTARVLVDLGANTLNVVTDLSLAADRGDPRGRRRADRLLHRGARRLGRLRAPVRAPGADPGRGSGLREVRSAERAEHLPVGDPSRGDRRSRLSRERVRRAQLALELLERTGSSVEMSEPGAADLAIPVAGELPPG